MLHYGSICPSILQYGPVSQYGLEWHSMLLYRPVWHSMVQYPPVWPSMPQYGPVWSRMAQYVPVWPSILQYAPVPPSMLQYAPASMFHYGPEGQRSSCLGSQERPAEQTCSSCRIALFFVCISAREVSPVVGLSTKCCVLDPAGLGAGEWGVQAIVGWQDRPPPIMGGILLML